MYLQIFPPNACLPFRIFLHALRRRSRISPTVHRVNSAVSFPVPAWIVKECSELPSPVLATTINVSFSEWIFLSRLGSAIISPILKSRTSIHSSSNPGVRFRTSILFRNCSSVSLSLDRTPTSPAINFCLCASQPIGRDTQPKQQSRL